MFEQLRQFRRLLQDNPRLWMVVVAGALLFILIVWGVYGGFSLEIGRFFAATPPTATLSTSPGTIPPGGTVTLTWSSTNATSCTVTAGNFGPISTSGTATEAISPAFTGTAQFRIRCEGPGGTVESNIASVNVVQPTGFPEQPVKPSPTQLRAYSRAQGWSEDFERFSDAVLQDWINCCWNVQARKFNSRRAGVEGLWEKPTECPAGQFPGGPNETDPCVTPATPPPAATSPPTTPVPTQPPGGPAAGTLVALCTGGSTPRITVQWSKSPPPGASGPFNPGNPAVLNRNAGGNAPEQLGPPPGIVDRGAYWEWLDTGVSSGVAVTYRGKYGATAGTNAVTVAATPANCGAATPTPTATAAPTPSPTSSAVPSPTAGALSCAPVAQTIAFGQLSEHTAEGGNGIYQWNAYPGATQDATAPGYAAFTWFTPGTKTVTVTSGGQTATCSVTVSSSGGATAFSVEKKAENLTRGGTEVRSGDTAEFTVTISVPVNGASGVFRLADAFPAGMSPVAGSVRWNLSRIDDPVKSGSSLIFEDVSLSAGSSGVLRYQGTADRTDDLPTGPYTGTYTAEVIETRSGATGRGAVTLTVFGTGAGGNNVTQIPTGPGDAVLFALIFAAAASLLYSAYTRSAGFRTREAEKLSATREPMDFRS